MPIINFPQKPDKEPPFFSDIKEDGYHIYNLNNAKKPEYYPPELPDQFALKKGESIEVFHEEILYKAKK